MRGELKAMCAEKNATVIHVTHDSLEAMALSDRVAVINRGKLMQIGPPDEVFHRPANEFVAGFLGEPPMSFVDVEYADDDGRAVFLITGTDTRLPAGPEVKAFVKEKGLPASFRLGVRATEVSVVPSLDDTHNVPGEAFVTETLGQRNILTAKLGKNLVQTVTPPELTFKVRDTAWFNLSEENLHVFADGLAVAHPRRQGN
jgi:multiple sugar transport system ATP-binding protein